MYKCTSLVLLPVTSKKINGLIRVKKNLDNSLPKIFVTVSSEIPSSIQILAEPEPQKHWKLRAFTSKSCIRLRMLWCCFVCFLSSRPWFSPREDWHTALWPGNSREGAYRILRIDKAALISPFYKVTAVRGLKRLRIWTSWEIALSRFSFSSHSAPPYLTGFPLISNYLVYLCLDVKNRPPRKVHHSLNDALVKDCLWMNALNRWSTSPCLIKVSLVVLT
jgi:hypothetical protein